MSAPRQITAWGTGRKLSLLGGSPDFQHTYHHNDVVRELVRAGSNMHAFVDLYGDEAMRSAAAEWRAALAKIAQEG